MELSKSPGTKGSLGEVSRAEAKKTFKLTNYVGLPTLIIGGFWIFLLILGVNNSLPFPDMLSDGLKRFGRWGILTLAMVPAIQSGVGPNFALPLGIVCGLVGEVSAINWGLSGASWLFAAFGVAVVLAIVMGFVYGKLMNAVKGSEMAIATYTGFAATYLFCLIWLLFPFKDQRLTWPLGGGVGVRQTIQLNQLGAAQILDNLWSFKFLGVVIPTGILLVFFGGCFLIWLFTRSKMGIAISAGGSNPLFARAAGLNVDNGRIIANIISTVLGAVGIVIYDQSFGYTQLYNNPLYMAFPAVAGILIGGASVSRSRIIHVIVGTFIFQGLMATSMPVANELFAGTDLSETMRMIIQNGVILYALAQMGGRK